MDLEVIEPEVSEWENSRDRARFNLKRVTRIEMQEDLEKTLVLLLKHETFACLRTEEKPIHRIWTKVLV